MRVRSKNQTIKIIAIELAVMHCEDGIMWEDYKKWADKIYNKINPTES